MRRILVIIVLNPNISASTLPYTTAPDHTYKAPSMKSEEINNLRCRDMFSFHTLI